MNWRPPLSRDVGVIVVAAGRGERLGTAVPKQFLQLDGVPVLLRALRPFTAHPDVRNTVLVLPEEQAAEPPGWLRELPGDSLRITAGGATRRASVAAGLRLLPEECGTIIVHDGARPFPPRDAIDQCIAAARDGRSAVTAIPVADTIKRADDFGRILGTVERAGLWHAQTPQGFPRDVLLAAHAAADNAGVDATDDAGLVERIGGRVELIPGDGRNIKITTMADLDYAIWLATGPR